MNWFPVQALRSRERNVFNIFVLLGIGALIGLLPSSSSESNSLPDEENVEGNQEPEIVGDPNHSILPFPDGYFHDENAGGTANDGLSLDEEIPNLETDEGRVDESSGTTGAVSRIEVGTILSSGSGGHLLVGGDGDDTHFH